MARRKKNDDPDQPDNADNNDDTFGLPEIEYEPLKREETVREETVTERTTSSSDPGENRTVYERETVQNEYNPSFDDDEESSPWPKILGVLAILAIAALAYWYFAKYQPQQKAEAARIERENAEAEERRRREEQANALERDRLAAEQRRADSLASLTSKVGSIETLSDRTRRYYVVVASAIDGDLIMDHAKRLSEKGVSTKIIPPFGKTKFYRLAVAEGDTYAATQTTADGMKGEYGEAVWVVRY